MYLLLEVYHTLRQPLALVELFGLKAPKYSSKNRIEIQQKRREHQICTCVWQVVMST